MHLPYLTITKWITTPVGTTNEILEMSLNYPGPSSVPNRVFLPVIVKHVDHGAQERENHKKLHKVEVTVISAKLTTLMELLPFIWTEKIFLNETLMINYASGNSLAITNILIKYSAENSEQRQ